MPVPVKMPKFGMTMTEGTLARWLVDAGEPVKKGQVIAEIETEKIVNELAAPADGTLAGIILNQDQDAQVAETIAWILVDGESADDIPSDEAQ